MATRKSWMEPLIVQALGRALREHGGNLTQAALYLHGRKGPSMPLRTAQYYLARYPELAAIAQKLRGEPKNTQ